MFGPWLSIIKLRCAGRHRSGRTRPDAARLARACCRASSLAVGLSLLWSHLNPVARSAAGSGPMVNIFGFSHLAQCSHLCARGVVSVLIRHSIHQRTASALAGAGHQLSQLLLRAGNLCSQVPHREIGCRHLWRMHSQSLSRRHI
jgi:hypothetical protein